MFALFLSTLLIFPCSFISYASDFSLNSEYPYKTDDILVRDPFILLHEGLYYMYGTGLATTNGYGCRVSPDLEHWSPSYNVFIADNSFDAAGDFWAPECHYYNGNFYLFASYRSKTTGFRGTSVFMSSSPLGPFVEISDGHITPHTADSIDGTLYIDSDGQPWMAYVCEWTATDDGVGRMAVAKLSDDLSHFISEPKEIFRADDPHWSASGVTDGPFLYTTSDGSLLMLWSTISHEGYCVGIARSCNNKIDGTWTQEFTRLYSRAFNFNTKTAFDGGHPMLFTSKEGKLMMAMHSPNSAQGEGEDRIFEHAVFFEAEEKCDTLRIEKYSCINRFFDTLVTFFNRISDVFEDLFGL